MEYNKRKNSFLERLWLTHKASNLVNYSTQVCIWQEWHRRLQKHYPKSVSSGKQIYGHLDRALKSYQRDEELYG
jgi:hypothetical protein